MNLKTGLESLPSFLFSSTAVLLAAIVGRLEIFFLCGRALVHVNQTEENKVLSDDCHHISYWYCVTSILTGNYSLCEQQTMHSTIV